MSSRLASPVSELRRATSALQFRRSSALILDHAGRIDRPLRGRRPVGATAEGWRRVTTHDRGRPAWPSWRSGGPAPGRITRLARWPGRPTASGSPTSSETAARPVALATAWIFDGHDARPAAAGPGPSADAPPPSSPLGDRSAPTAPRSCSTTSPGPITAALLASRRQGPGLRPGRPRRPTAAAASRSSGSRARTGASSISQALDDPGRDARRWSRSAVAWSPDGRFLAVPRLRPAGLAILRADNGAVVKTIEGASLPGLVARSAAGSSISSRPREPALHRVPRESPGRPRAAGRGRPGRGPARSSPATASRVVLSPGPGQPGAPRGGRAGRTPPGPGRRRPAGSGHADGRRAP